MPTILPKIPVNTFRFSFKTEGTIRLPKYPGSAWRGAFGHALKKTVCVVHNTPCAACLFKTACTYTYIFETSPPPTTVKLRKYNTVPHPFVLQFPQPESLDQTCYQLDIVLFGHGQRYLPFIIHSLQKAGQDGIGGHRQLFELLSIDEINTKGSRKTIYLAGELTPQNSGEYPTIPDMPEEVEIVFHTPLRIKQDGKNITPRELNFATLFSTLLRRISLISYFHTDTPLEIDFAAITQLAKTVDWTTKKLEWYDWTRYSSRQETEMNMGGMIGRTKLAMQGLEAFWPYLWLGQWTHVGKGTSMGMGAYTIQSTSLSTSKIV
jgi:CRISPR/Cas system endoribonuclease Cas6 (RAMP superfamily)